MPEMLDIYHGDGAVDWAQLKGHIDAVYLKATESTGFTDSAYRVHADAAQAAGIPHGGYLFLRPGDGLLQERHFEAIAGMDVTPGNLRGCLDIEDPAVGPRTAEAAMAAYQQAHGHGPVVYGSRSFFDERPWLVALCQKYGCPLWVAAYGPKRPAYGAAWQYTSSGRLPGVGHVVDLSHVWDLAALMVPGSVHTADSGGGVTPANVPTPPEADVKLLYKLAGTDEVWLWSGVTRVHVTSPPVLDALVRNKDALGIAWVDMDGTDTLQPDVHGMLADATPQDAGPS